MMKKQKTTKETSQAKAEKNKAANPFGAWNETVQPWMNMWKHFVPGGLTAQQMDPQSGAANFTPDWFKMYNEMVPTQTVGIKDLYQKYMDTAEVYTKLFQSWVGVLQNKDKPVTPEIFKDLLNGWLASQKDIFSNLFGLPLPINPGDFDDPAEWAKGIKQSIENWYELYQDNYKPMLDNWHKASENIFEMMRPNVTSLTGPHNVVPSGTSGSAKVQEFYESMMKGYEATLGKFLKIPAVGPSRQVSEKIAHSVDAFVKYCGSSVDFYLSLYQPARAAVEELSQKASQTLKGEITMDKYKEFYNLLIKTFEEKFYALFKTPAFANVLKTTLDASLQFRQNHFAVMEEVLKSTPVITRKEMDEVHQELYNLKKRIKEMSRRFDRDLPIYRDPVRGTASAGERTVKKGK